MTPAQNFIAAPFRLFGWLWTTAKTGWSEGAAAAAGKLPPRQLIRILHPNKLEAIKALRNAILGMSLKESKDICDQIALGNPFTLPDVLANPDALRDVFEIIS